MFTFLKHKTLLSLLVELDLQKDIILQKQKLLYYLEVKVFEIEQIYNIRNIDLREEFLKKNVSEDLLKLEINDIKYDINALCNHFVKYIDYNFIDSLFKCTHPGNLYTDIRCYLCNASFILTTQDKNNNNIYKLNLPKEEFTEKEFQLSDKILRFMNTNNMNGKITECS